MKRSEATLGLWRQPCVRRAAVLAAVLLFVAAGVAAAGAWLQWRQAQALHAAQAELGALRTEAAALAPESDAIERAIDVYRALQRAVFVGRADAIALTEWLQASAAARGLAAPAFELAVAPGEPLQEPGGSLRQFDLKVQWQGLHEEELLALLDELAHARLGSFAVRRCRLQRAADTAGVQAACELRWSVFEPERAS
jgi:protein-disulfide isomerase-like protein with CxxC motif